MTTMIDVTTAILHRYADTGARRRAVLESLQAAEVPTHLQMGLARYFIDGIRPGDFLQAVLRNDLREAVVRAGDPSSLGPLIVWLNNCVPAPSWGDPSSVQTWIATQGRGDE